MKSTISLAAFATVFILAAPASAKDWSRTWTGPHGGTRSSAVTCGGGACDRTVQALGPNGASRALAGRCDAGGCQRNVTGAGRDGRTWSRSSRFRR